MKKKKLFLSLCLSALVVQGCKTNDDATPLENCQVISIESDGIRRGFKYDGAGLVKTMTIDLNGFVLDIELLHDSKGRLMESKWSMAGAAYQKEAYSYADGKINRVDIFLAEDSLTVFAVDHISYNQAGWMSVFEIEYMNEDLASEERKYLYEYNPAGMLTSYLQLDGAGNQISKVITKPSGAMAPKASEQYLIDHGLPYDLPFGYPLSTTDPGEGSVMEAYQPGPDGNLQLKETLTLKLVRANSRGFMENAVWADPAGKEVINLRYAFDQCK